MKKHQFKGYILEEIIAHLIKTSGYSLIIVPSQKDPDITSGHNGLNVRGRGTKHQIDVLGEMNWIPSFHFPLRLIIEAKFQSKKEVGIEVVRGQVGILSDINENYFVNERRAPRPRYRYSSVVVSTSGFTKPAVDMAIAHQIQLIDFSSIEYKHLRSAIENLADALAVNGNIQSDELRNVKSLLRRELSNGGIRTLNEGTNKNVYQLLESIRGYRELFVGMSQGGHMLLLKANNPDEFISYAKQNPTHNVIITWDTTDNGKVWTIKPNHGDNYSLSFKLPTSLHRWIYKISEDKYAEALNQKDESFSKISIFYKDLWEGRDYIFNLMFNKQNFEVRS